MAINIVSRKLQHQMRDPSALLFQGKSIYRTWHWFTQAREILDQLAQPRTGILECRGYTKAATFHLAKGIAKDLLGKAAYTKEPRNNNLNILAALTGALRRCRLLAWNGHAAHPVPCTASRQHLHNCPSYYFSAPKTRGLNPIRYAEMVKAYLEHHRSISPQECRELLGLGGSQSAKVEVSRYLKTRSSGAEAFLVAVGHGPNRQYSLIVPGAENPI